MGTVLLGDAEFSPIEHCCRPRVPRASVLKTNFSGNFNVLPVFSPYADHAQLKNARLSSIERTRTKNTTPHTTPAMERNHRYWTN